MKQTRRFVSVMCLLIAPLSLSSCLIGFSSTGESGATKKERFLNSYLVTSLERFYPDGIPSDPDKVYPDLSLTTVKDMEEELIGVAREVVGLRHSARRMYIVSGMKKQLPEKVITTVRIEKFAAATANIDRDGLIHLDVKVLQALFRGVLLASFSDPMSLIHDALGPKRAKELAADAYTPGLQTERQRKALQTLWDAVAKVKATPGESGFQEFLRSFRDETGAESPWTVIARTEMGTESLEMTHKGAILFLLAHEQGHVAMGHHAELDRLSGTATIAAKDVCARAVALELEADMYALLLLRVPRNEVAWLAPPLWRLTDGYRPYLGYAYELAGFRSLPKQQCEYPSNKARLAVLEEAEKSLFQDELSKRRIQQ